MHIQAPMLLNITTLSRKTNPVLPQTRKTSCSESYESYRYVVNITGLAASLVEVLVLLLEVSASLIGVLAWLVEGISVSLLEVSSSLLEVSVSLLGVSALLLEPSASQCAI